MLSLNPGLHVMAGHFTVYVGAQPYIDGMSQPSPSLVTDADVEKLREATRCHATAIPTYPFKVVETVLGATEHSGVIWYQFNDSRLNGVLSAECWRTFYPNATCLTQAERSTRTLHSLLDEWVSPHGSPLLQGTIVLCQGDHLETLHGLNHWEDSISTIFVTGPAAERVWINRLEPWLHERGFWKEPDKLCWQRDRISLLLKENQRLKEQIKHAFGILDNLIGVIDRQSL